MTAVAYSVPAGVRFDPLRDKSYRDTAIGADIVDFIAWMELGGASKRTLDTYERDLARGALMYPDLPLTGWADGELLHVAKSFTPGQRRVRVATYRSFFKWAKQMRRIADNPVEYLPVQKRRPQRAIDIFSDAEIEALLSLDTRDAAPLAILLDAGLRKAEARHLRLRHCRPESGKVAVIGGKGGKDRVVPMSARLSSLLADLALTEALKPDDHVFYAVRANEVSRRILRSSPTGEGTFARWWRACLDRAGVGYRNPHTARHTFATRWRRRGLALDELQMLLGHASVQTTSDLYVHTGIEDVAEHMALIEARERA